MIRTQIQLTEQQVKVLKAWAAARNVSMAEIIRMSLDQMIRAQILPMTDEAERRRRAIAAAGKFKSEAGDLSARHDEYFAQEHG